MAVLPSCIFGRMAHFFVWSISRFYSVPSWKTYPNKLSILDKVVAIFPISKMTAGIMLVSTLHSTTLVNFLDFSIFSMKWLEIAKLCYLFVRFWGISTPLNVVVWTPKRQAAHRKHAQNIETIKLKKTNSTKTKILRLRWLTMNSGTILSVKHYYYRERASVKKRMNPKFSKE